MQGTAFRSSSIFAPLRSLITHRSQQTAMLSCRAAKVSADEAFSLVQGDHAYLDVRTADEFAGGHIEGAVSVPVWLKGPDGFSPNPDFVSSVEELFPDKSTKICVGCLSGKRSEAATAALEQAGYSDLSDMTVGYNGWCQAGLPTTTS